MSIEIQQISKTFNQFTALSDVNLCIPTGELVALLGPSGCGKTTLLRIIAGLETPDQGTILFHGENATTQHVRDRQVGFVFQHYALFRHMNVFENVAFGLRVRPRKTRPAHAQIREKVNELLRLVQLTGLAERYPRQLSGGQRQRVALARALAVEPKVLLLDEPFGALDTQVRKELRRWLRRLHDEMHITSVFVTHDQEEAMEVADQVVVMNAGQVEQVGTPDELYEHPATPFVYRFLGNVNLFHGRINKQRGDLEIVTNTHEAMTVESQNTPAIPYYIPPHDLEIKRHAEADTISAVIHFIHVYGSTVRLELTQQPNGEPLEAELSKDEYRSMNLQKGEQVFVKLHPDRAREFVDIAANI